MVNGRRSQARHARAGRVWYAHANEPMSTSSGQVVGQAYTRFRVGRLWWFNYPGLLLHNELEFTVP